jgi:hypothetical protein
MVVSDSVFGVVWCVVLYYAFNIRLIDYK